MLVLIRYIYKITFESGKTYIGQRKYNGDKLSEDKYLGSSTYAKNNPQDKIVNKEILISGEFDVFTLNLLETDSIIFEKLLRGDDCVNGTFGGLNYNYLPRIKGIYKPSKESIEKNRISHLNTSNDVKIKISNSVSKLWQDEKYRCKQKEVHKNKKSHLGFKNSLEQKQHISEGHKGIKYSLECKQKHSTIMQKRMGFMKKLYKDYKNINPEIKWNEFLSKYSRGEIK